MAAYIGNAKIAQRGSAKIDRALGSSHEDPRPRHGSAARGGVPPSGDGDRPLKYSRRGPDRTRPDDADAAWSRPSRAIKLPPSAFASDVRCLDQAFWEGLTALNDDRAALLLDAHGQVARASAAALKLLDAEDGLALSQRRLTAHCRADDDRLTAVIAAATRQTDPVAGAIRLPRTSGRSALLLTICPLAYRRHAHDRTQVLASATIVDPSRIMPPRPNLLQSLFDLTMREAECVEMLMLGHSVESAAAMLRMAIPTARTHLRNIFQKTNTVRQTDLLQLLSRLA